MPGGAAVFLEQSVTAPDVQSVAMHSGKKEGLESYKGTLPFPLSLTLNVVVPHCILVDISMLVDEIEYFSHACWSFGFSLL